MDVEKIVEAIALALYQCEAKRSKAASHIRHKAFTARSWRATLETMTTTRRPLENLLLSDALSPRELWVNCPHCRMNRRVDPAPWIERGLGHRQVASLPFRCSKCDRLGRPWVSGWEDGGRTTWEG